MSGTGGAAPPTAVLGLDVGGPWRRGAVLKSRASVQADLHSVAAPPALPGEGSGTRAPLRLPSLVATTKGPRRRSGMARLSLSEPSLLLPSESILLEGFSSSRRFSVLQKQPPRASSLSKPSTLLPCKTCRPFETHEQQKTQQLQSCSRPAYMHISQAIQPRLRPRATRRHSHSPAMSSETMRAHLRASAALHRDLCFQEEPLSVVGKSCRLSCSQRPAAAGPARTQLHVFLPSEAEGEEADRESVDEGFMDELDTRISLMKLQQTAPQTAASPSQKNQDPL